MARGPLRAGRDSSKSTGVWSRDWIIVVLLAIFLAAILARLFYVQIVKGAEYSDMAATSHTTEVSISAKRGTVYDRNGEVLASNVKATTIYVNPKEVTAPINVAQILYSVLGKKYDKTYDDYYALVTKSDTTFVYIQRKASVKLAKKLKKRLNQDNLTGVHFLEDTKRVYPNDSTASQVIGSVDIDGKGISGLEMQYDSLLAGTDGKVRVEQGLNQIPISDGQIEETKAEDGEDIVISLDVRLQSRVEKTLLKAIKSYSAAGGTATVMDASTGEVYASCSYSKSDSGSYSLDSGKLASFTDAYEPGSTFKTATAISVLENKAVSTSSTFTVPYSMRVYDYTIHDSHSHGTEQMTFKQIIAESSNVGTILASRQVKKSQLYKTYSKLGFGKNPGTDFPGTASGTLEKSDDWDPVQAANISFGHGMLVTPAQIIRLYGAVEQNGVERVPHFLTDVPNDSDAKSSLTADLTKSKRVTSKSVCKDVKKMLRAVVTDGTGTKAKVKGFTVAGKTGSAEVASSSGGYGNGYIVSFCGWLDGSSSDLVCLVTIKQPKTEEGGGPVCGPVFSDIMSYAAERYRINPNAD